MDKKFAVSGGSTGGTPFLTCLKYQLYSLVFKLFEALVVFEVVKVDIVFFEDVFITFLLTIDMHNPQIITKDIIIFLKNLDILI
ncbi:hypothetical protein CLG_B1578 [Clostridium botulinum D str. 1873]|uniref:Uncharacterized protein n=1 Tax=Clostridium botulinum D str. 1873 TaxID=592027 RepID=A0A9P2LL15_CLOBO|nr:hypothetical protein CLG_B1578 [Clostridium botulinum D str. 1873]